MQVKLAKEMGFCFGVRRGITLVERMANERGPLQTLGSLVHNRQVVEHLSESGVTTIDKLDQVKGNAVVVATHGVPSAVIEDAERRGIEVIDATCPYVRAIQKRAREMSEDGLQVIVFGDRGHTEVIGIVGWTDGKAIVVGNVEELDQIELSKRVGVVAQTTRNSQDYENFVQALTKRCLASGLELRIHNTICNATTDRQAAVVELADTVDLVLVVGGRDSANTGRLAEISWARGVPTYHIEDASQISYSWFDGCRCVGITAGASTPDWVIQEVVKAVEMVES